MYGYMFLFHFASVVISVVRIMVERSDKIRPTPFGVVVKSRLQRQLDLLLRNTFLIVTFPARRYCSRVTKGAMVLPHISSWSSDC